MEMTFDDAPSILKSESCSDYFERCKDYWILQARSINKDENLSISGQNLETFAKEICESAFKSEESTK